MKIGSLFSGIGGLELGLEWAGLGHTVWQVENDPFCQQILTRHWPKAQRLGDIRAAHPGKVDLICGGFPCQDVSVAGKRAGLAGTKSGLWTEFRRIIDETQPRWVVVENVYGGRRAWLPQVRRDLYVSGYESTAVALSAADVGAPHLRRRIFVIAYPKRFAVRFESRWSQWARGENSLQLTGYGQARPTPNTDSQGQLQPQGRKPQSWHRTRDGGWWTPESPVSRMGHGISNRVDRERTLGNAVVPACSYIIGKAILACK